MKVAILNNDFRVYWKGRLIFLQKFLASQEIDFFAIELFGKGSPYSFDIYNNNEHWWTCLFPNSSSDDLSTKDIEKGVFSALDEIGADIIIASSIVFYAGALGMRWAKRNNRKFIMFDDARPLQVKRNFIVQWVKNLITEQADGLWFPSKDYDNDYSWFHQKGIHFFYGFNCVDNQLFKFKDEKRLDHKTIVCVARLVPVKNIDNLLNSWSLIEQKNTGFKLVIIGDGPEYDHLKKLTTDLNLSNAELIGTLENNALPEYFYHADALVLPSLSESWGLVVNEAMAASLPVLLSSKINANHALLQEGANGFSFNPLSVKDITDTILRYTELDIEKKKEMSENSLAIINTMSYDKMASQLLEALNNIATKKSKRPGLTALFIINLWPGQYNKSGWDKL